MEGKVLFLFMFLFFAPAFANEGGEGEKKPAGKPPEKTQAQEYVEKTTKLGGLQTKIDDSEKEFAKLVEEKEHEREPARLQSIIKGMLEIEKKRNQDVEDFNRVKEDLAYRYPAMNTQLNHDYRNEEKKNSEELESGANLDELLTRTKRAIDRKFASFGPATPEPKASPAPVAAPKRLKLEK